MTTPSLIFRSRLRELRLLRGLSQTDLAEHIHVSATTINRYEQGERQPNIDTLKNISDFFSVDFNYLLGYPAGSPPWDEHDLNLLCKYRSLDDRGKSAVLNVLEHEHACIAAK